MFAPQKVHKACVFVLHFLQNAWWPNLEAQLNSILKLEASVSYNAQGKSYIHVVNLRVGILNGHKSV